jgi:signal transduction histidine kinase
MKIRNKISLTFILLLVFGVTAVSSYAILFIRNYLLEEGEKTIYNHAIWLGKTMDELRYEDEFFDAKISELEQISGYTIKLYFEQDLSLMNEIDRNPDLNTVEVVPNFTSADFRELELNSVLLINEPNSNSIYVFVALEGAQNPAKLIRVSKEKKILFEPITTIRWIIYSGMFISIGVIFIVSYLFARYLARPITELKLSAQRVAEGKSKMISISGRTDEFGDLASSINSMALQLREDNERLAEINEKQSRFFADITHEIRNPLHTILASMDLLQVGTLDEEKQKRYIQNARSQAERIGSLFKDLLTLQRYDSDENFIQAQWFDLQRITSRLEELYLDDAFAKGIRLNIQKSNCRVLADYPKIEQVLDNLISNALKYTNEGEVTLSYVITDKRVTISVTDTGIGIADEHISNLFDRFYRTDKARSRDSGGTGLGLSVVKSILDAHGSDINVESTLGLGTRFWFALPAK